MHPFTTMTGEFLAGAFRDVYDQALVVGARTLAGRVGRDGADIGARRLQAEYGAPRS